jgi:hypothetical protein
LWVGVKNKQVWHFLNIESNNKLVLGKAKPLACLPPKHTKQASQAQTQTHTHTKEQSHQATLNQARPNEAKGQATDTQQPVA